MLSRVIQVENNSFYIDKFCNAGTNREYAEVVRARYKVDSTDMQNFLSFAEQRAFVRILDINLGAMCRRGWVTRMTARASRV